jgi:hypothetical protein
VVGLTLLALNRQRIVRRDINLVSIIPLIGVLSIIISPEAETLWPHGIRTLAQLTYSIVMAYSVYLELSHWPRAAVARLFGIALAVLTIGSILEVHTPVKQISDRYRTVVYSENIEAGQTFYDPELASARDLELASHIRPTFFTQEPSYVALTLLLCLIAWFQTTTHYYATPIYFLCLTGGVYSIRSPILISAIPIWLVSRQHTRAQILKLLIASLPILAGCIILFLARLDVRPNGEDKSTAARITLPYMLAYQTIQDYPISGVGIGQIETYADTILRLSTNIGINFDLIPASIPIHSVALCNAFCIMIVYFGAGLSLLMLLNLRTLIRVYGAGQYLYVTTAILVLSNSQGSFVSPRLWAQLWILMAVAHLTTPTNGVVGSGAAG